MLRRKRSPYGPTFGKTALHESGCFVVSLQGNTHKSVEVRELERSETPVFSQVFRQKAVLKIITGDF